MSKMQAKCATCLTNRQANKNSSFFSRPAHRKMFCFFIIIVYQHLSLIKTSIIMIKAKVNAAK